MASGYNSVDSTCDDSLESFSNYAVNCSLYLVTDSTPALLGNRDLVDVVDRAIGGGVTCVQLRDKTSSTSELIATARRLHEVTKMHGVPLLINDRVDVALAVGCEGVHIGQDDMGASSLSLAETIADMARRSRQGPETPRLERHHRCHGQHG